MKDEARTTPQEVARTVVAEVSDDIGMAYIRFEAPSEARTPYRSIAVEDEDGEIAFVLDVNTDGALAGIEIFGAGALLPPLFRLPAAGS